MADPKTSPQRPAAATRSAVRRPLHVVTARPDAGQAGKPAKRLTDPASRAARRRLILDTLAAIARSGQAVTAARICVSGDVLLLTENQSLPPDDPTDDLDWVTLAGQT